MRRYDGCYMWEFGVCRIISHRLEHACMRVDEIYERDVFYDFTLMDWLVCIIGGLGQVKISLLGYSSYFREELRVMMGP